MDRRMARLKKRRTVQGKPDDYLELLLDDALDCFLDYTHRINDPGERIDGIVCELASHWSNMEGVEYTATVKEADMMRNWDAVPDAIRKRMMQYRLIIGINAEVGNAVDDD